jgi:hypothetical protein
VLNAIATTGAISGRRRHSERLLDAADCGNGAQSAVGAEQKRCHDAGPQRLQEDARRRQGEEGERAADEHFGDLRRVSSCLLYASLVSFFHTSLQLQCHSAIEKRRRAIQQFKVTKLNVSTIPKIDRNHNIVCSTTAPSAVGVDEAFAAGYGALPPPKEKKKKKKTKDGDDDKKSKKKKKK